MIAVFSPSYAVLREGGLSSLAILSAAGSPLPACGERSDRVSDPGEKDSRHVQSSRLFPEILHRHGALRVPLTRPRFAVARRTRRASDKDSEGLRPSVATSPRKRGEVRRCDRLRYPVSHTPL